MSEHEQITLAQGKTFDCKEHLKTAGFRYYNETLGGQMHVWVRDPSLSDNEIMSLSRKIANMDVDIRNVRKSFVL